MHRQGALLSTLPFPGGRRERAPALRPTTLPQLFAPITSTKPEAVGQGAQWGSSGSELWAAPTPLLYSAPTQQTLPSWSTPQGVAQESPGLLPLKYYHPHPLQLFSYNHHNFSRAHMRTYTIFYSTGLIKV